MATKGSTAQSSTDYADGYLLDGDTNSTNRLVSSLAFLLREKNYVGLYDTSVMFSPEEHLRRNEVAELDRDLLFKTYVFLNGLARALDGFDNLVIVPEVAAELGHLVQSALAALEKRKNEYQGLPAERKAEASQCYEQVIKLEPLLGLVARRVERRAELPEGFQQELFDELLGLIRFIEQELEIKKRDSRKTNDTDERIAARSLYELLVNKHNVAVYTRDDDVRKLISTFFKLIGSCAPGDNGSPKHFDYFNVLVLKYDPSKRVYRRFFESSTDRKLEQYYFPKRIGAARQKKLLAELWERIARLDARLRDLEGLDSAAAAQAASRPDSDTVRRALKSIYEQLQSATEPQLETLEALRVLALDQADQQMLQQVEGQIRTRAGERIERQIHELELQQAELERSLGEAIASGSFDLAKVDQVDRLNQELRQTILRRTYLACLLAAPDLALREEDFPRFALLVERFREAGHAVDCQEVCLPTDEIAALAQKGQMEVIERIEAAAVRHEGTRAFLCIAQLIHFL